MTPDEVSAKIEGRQFMTRQQAHMVRGFIQFFKLKLILELGHMHGASTCQLAAAAQTIGGSLTTIDVRRYDPSVQDNLARCELENVTVHVESESAGGEWRLLQLLEAGLAGTFDLIYIDARHLWRDCAADFVMAARLVRPGGWLLFDDLKLDHSTYPDDCGWIKAMSAEERATPQVGKVWAHLVKTDDRFTNFTEHGNWGFCQRRPAKQG